ncbi:phenylalanine--tRNA ligase subunit alpha [Haliovirga abyssi]|uniref:Phenylalanine--tRNA ligase alpha subunit n=1 Tax=Haliovirga abyssi TaxID=2996794 RepID=A0AAU9DVC5_9FUSO|nr:phenylalanine--tRNA ligase subunit alpha [Haliovirga abyssi]BDU51339.1 phenylalanine--tRNA ligase alpha subunit [Haliovirga abyssi]
MKEKIIELKEKAKDNIEKIANLKEFEDIKIKLMGKKGEFTQILKGMKEVSKEDRPIIGQIVNETRNFLNGKLEEKFNILKEKEKEEKLKKEVIDITLPGKKVAAGRLHPITETTEFLKEIFIEMGFDISDGPEVELDYYNFTALNIPETHPSRDLQDTFYIEDDVVLRTQTSPVQIRYMKEHKPPLRMICPGKVYRSDYDISHTPMFHQMEGLMVGENISFANLKAILEEFVIRAFGERKTRFRPHFFPFTEPSAEMDVECVVCGGKGCRVCKGSGWLEIMGCGMVDPKVLEEVGYDSTKYSGFAFGVGIERVAMLRKGIDDLRAFFENDMRFLRQFK